MQTRSLLLNLCMVSVAVCTLASLTARGDTIVSVAGSDTLGVTLGGPSSQVLQVGWTTSSQAYENVSIDATLWDSGGFDPTITAYLTTQIGSPGTPVATASVNIAPGLNPSVYTLFSSQELAANTTYYVVLAVSSNAGQDNITWQYNNGASKTTAPGVTLGANGVANTGEGTLNTSYAPASTFVSLSSELLFDVTGTPMAAVPEPSSLALLLLLISLGGIALRRREKSLA